MEEDRNWFVGVDWATEAHRVRVSDAHGRKIGERSFPHGGAGLAEMADWILDLTGAAPEKIHVAIEVPHGPVVESLMGRGFRVHAINPKQLDRFRDRFSPAGAKDDSRDAEVLADALRTDPHAFRRLAPIDPGVVEHKWELFLELLRWSEGGSCRHDSILRYFGDEAETLTGCGRCDECQRLDEPDAHDAHDAAEAEEIVRKALSGVARVRGRFGLRAAVNLVRGMKDDRLLRSGLDRTTTFGVLKDRSEMWLLRLYQRLVTAGWVGFRGEDRPVVELTAAGRDVMTGQRPPRVLLPREVRRGPAGASRGSRVARAPEPDGPWGEAEEALFQALRARRHELASAARVPAYVIAHDRTLRDLARLRPRSADALGDVYGLGAAKIARSGKAFLEVIARFA